MPKNQERVYAASCGFIHASLLLLSMSTGRPNEVLLICIASRALFEGESQCNVCAPTEHAYSALVCAGDYRSAS
jgi:hypothetical protein